MVYRWAAEQYPIRESTIAIDSSPLVLSTTMHRRAQHYPNTLTYNYATRTVDRMDDRRGARGRQACAEILTFMAGQDGRFCENAIA